MAPRDPADEKDQLCMSGADTGDAPKKGSGGVGKPSAACKNQQWDIAASVTDTTSGAKVTIAQGVALRVSAEVGCPAGS